MWLQQDISEKRNSISGNCSPHILRAVCKNTDMSAGYTKLRRLTAISLREISKVLGNSFAILRKDCDHYRSETHGQNTGDDL